MAAKVPRRLRPANRKALVAAAAAELFRQNGFHNVTMGMISARVGIAPSALYKHFSDKRKLLLHIILNDLVELEGVIDRAAASEDPVRALVTRLADFAVERRGFALLQQREARNLVPEDMAAMSARHDAMVAKIAAMVATDRPELDDRSSELLARIALAIAASPSYHRLQLAGESYRSLLGASLAAALKTPLAGDHRVMEWPRDDRKPSPLLLARVSRREALLSASTRMFAQMGYPAITMVEIGAAVGITGPSVYNHFNSKADLLIAAMRRGAEWLQMGLEAALSTSRTAKEALAKLMSSYVAFAIAHNPVLESLVAETHHLPAEMQNEARGLQREYVAEWVQLLRKREQRLDEAEARAIVLGLLATLNHFARSHRFAKEPALEASLVAVASVILEGGCAFAARAVTSASANGGRNGVQQVATAKRSGSLLRSRR